MNGMNASIGASLHQWNIDFDPHHFVENADWAEHAGKTGDLLQMVHAAGRLFICASYCNGGVYTGAVVGFPNWWSPIESYETTDSNALNTIICAWIEKYANGTFEK